jgi:hypothetical protein
VGLQELSEPVIWLCVMAIASVVASILVFRKEAA